MHSVDVIAAYHVHYDVERMPFGFLVRWVQPHITPVLPHDRRPAFRDMLRGHCLCRRVISPIRVEPRVNQNAAFMCLSDQKSQRVKVLRLAHPAGQKFGPWFELRAVNCIRHRPHLKYHGIQPHLDGKVDDGQKFRPLLFDGEISFRGKIDIVDRRNPNAAKLARNFR